MMTSIRRPGVLAAVLLLGVSFALERAARAFDVVLNAQNEYLDAYLIDGSDSPRRVVFIDPDPPEPDNPNGPLPRVGRHVNGKLCFFPEGTGHPGQFLIADDTYREACIDRSPPQARCASSSRRSRRAVPPDPDGWAVFRRNGRWTGQHIHTPWDFTEPQPQGTIDPQGCAFDAAGNFWGTDVGHGSAEKLDGSLLVFFRGKHNRYDTYCFLDKALAAPGMPAMDASGSIYVPESAPPAFKVTKFSPPFPTSAADCDNSEHLVTTPPTKTSFITAASSGLITPAGIVRVPGSDHFYIGSVLLPPVINEYDAAGAFVRNIVPSGVPRNPLGIDVGSDGTIYYSELNLDPVTFDTRCGSMSMVRFDAGGQPQAPIQIGKDLAFPDGVTVVDSKQMKIDWEKLPPAPPFDPAGCGGE
jgi:hypothetical protein